MKFKLFGTLCLAVLALNACMKPVQLQQPKEEEKKQIKIPVKITAVSTNPSGSYIATITYDSKNRLAKIQQGFNTKTFTYNGDDLINMADMNYNYTISYNNGVPAGVLSTGGATPRNYTYTIINGKVTKRTMGLESYTFNYNGNNLLSGIDEHGAITQFQYSSVKSPYYNVRLKYLLAPIGVPDTDYFSENAISQFDSSTQDLTKATYTYVTDSEGLPISAVIQSTHRGAGATYTTNVTYEYEVRDVVK